MLFSSILFEVRDLAQPLKPVEETKLTRPGFIRTYKTLQILRSYYPALIEHDRDPLQLIIGQLRYSLHTLSFLESNHYHKLWALYNSGYFGQQIRKKILSGGQLRINWIDHKVISPGSIGLTILPGRKDYSRSIDEDLKQLKEYGIDTIIPLLTDDEFFHYGVGDLTEKYNEMNFNVHRLPIMDQLVCSSDEIREMVSFIDKQVEEGKKVMIHCVGGLGRSGMVAAAYLKYKGLNYAEAINTVRKFRGPRAIESKVQEEFVQNILFT